MTPISFRLQCELLLEQQVNLVTGRCQKEVLLHLETLACGVWRCNDFVFTQDGANM